MKITAKLWTPSSTHDFFRFYLKYESESYGSMFEKTLGFVEIRNKQLDFSNINPIYHNCLKDVFDAQIDVAIKKYNEEEGDASYLDIIKYFDFDLIESTVESDFTKKELEDAEVISDFLGLPRLSGEFADVLWATLLRLFIVQKIGVDDIQNKKIKKNALTCDFWISSRNCDIPLIKHKAFYK